MAKEKKDAKTEEETSEKNKNNNFVELVEVRVSKPLPLIAVISNLADKTKYECSTKEVQQI